MTFGLEFAFIALAMGISFGNMFKAFAISMIVVVVLYGIILGVHKQSVISILGLLAAGTALFLGIQAGPQYFPLQTVPMALVMPGVPSTPTVVVPDAIVVLVMAVFLGLLFKLMPNGTKRPTGHVILATVVTFFAVASILGYLFGEWSEWIIMLTPFTGLPLFGFIFALAYVGLAFLIWEGYRLAAYAYAGILLVGSIYAVFLGEWLSIIISLLVVAYIFFARHGFQDTGTPSMPSL